MQSKQHIENAEKELQQNICKREKSFWHKEFRMRNFELKDAILR